MELAYKPSTIRTSVSGPDVPLPLSSGTWSGTATGGTSPYTIRRYRNGELVGTGSSYSASGFTSEFGLRMEVSDQYNTTMSTNYWVDVGGVRVAMSGPTLVYSSQGRTHERAIAVRGIGDPYQDGGCEPTPPKLTC